MPKTTSQVPHGTSDPIQYLLEHGRTMIDLATEWGFKTTDTIYRLKRFDYAPPAPTASKLAKTFGWTAGEVTDYWLVRVAKARKTA